MMENHKQLRGIIESCRPILRDEALKEVDHFFSHDEPEMALEGLIIELMKADVIPPSFDYGEWYDLAKGLGLDTEPVFDGEFWTKFVAWGREQTN